jgi:hypothetical protein
MNASVSCSKTTCNALNSDVIRLPGPRFAAGRESLPEERDVKRMPEPRNPALKRRGAWRIAMPLSALCTALGLAIDIIGLPTAIERDFAWLTAPGKPSDVAAWMLYIVAGILLVLAITSREKTRR